MKHRKSTAFYIETLLVTLLFLAMTAVLVRMFAAARSQSLEARALTDAGQIAQNVSETFYGAPDEAGFWALWGVSAPQDAAPATLTVNAAGQPEENGGYTLLLALADAPEQAGNAGRLVRLSLTVQRAATGQELYTGQFDRYLPAP